MVLILGNKIIKYILRGYCFCIEECNLKLCVNSMKIVFYIVFNLE